MAKEIRSLITALESKLRRLPPPLYDFLFTPPWALGTVVPDGLLAVRTTYRAEALGPLRRMRLDCKRFLADEKKEKKHPARGPEVDRAQRRCAILAYDLMATLSEKRITSYAEGHYVRIASLLFEALKGPAEVDLKRHCRFVIKARPHLVVPAA